MSKLRPSLTVALLAVSEEVAELRKRGECVFAAYDTLNDEGEPCVTIITWPGSSADVHIFGFTDDSEMP